MGEDGDKGGGFIVLDLAEISILDILWQGWMLLRES